MPSPSNLRAQQRTTSPNEPIFGFGHDHTRRCAQVRTSGVCQAAQSADSDRCEHTRHRTSSAAPRPTQLRRLGCAQARASEPAIGKTNIPKHSNAIHRPRLQLLQCRCVAQNLTKQPQPINANRDAPIVLGDHWSKVSFQKDRNMLPCGRVRTIVGSRHCFLRVLWRRRLIPPRALPSNMSDKFNVAVQYIQSLPPRSSPNSIALSECFVCSVSSVSLALTKLARQRATADVLRSVQASNTRQQ